VRACLRELTLFTYDGLPVLSTRICAKGGIIWKLSKAHVGNGMQFCPRSSAVKAVFKSCFLTSSIRSAPKVLLRLVPPALALSFLRRVSFINTPA
jgi:hypothetical protein